MAFCYTLNGTSRYVTVADHSSLDFVQTQDFSIEIQFKTSTKAAAQGLVNKLAGGIGWKIWLDTSGYVNASVDDGTDEVTFQSATDYSDGAWHAIQLSIDRQNQVARLFVAGAIIQTKDISAVGTLANAATMYVGVDETGAASYFNGSLAELRISTVARAVQAYTVDAFQFKDDHMTALLFHFNEGSGVTCYDMSSEDGSGTERRNNGTYVGGAVWSAPNLLASPTNMMIDLCWRAIDVYSPMASVVTKWGVKKFRMRAFDFIPPENLTVDHLPFLSIMPGNMGKVEMATYDSYKFPQSITIKGIAYSNDLFLIDDFRWLCYKALLDSFSIEGGRLGCGHVYDFESSGASFMIQTAESGRILSAFEDTILFDYRENL